MGDKNQYECSVSDLNFLRNEFIFLVSFRSMEFSFHIFAMAKFGNWDKNLFLIFSTFNQFVRFGSDRGDKKLLRERDKLPLRRFRQNKEQCSLYKSCNFKMPRSLNRGSVWDRKLELATALMHFF